MTTQQISIANEGLADFCEEAWDEAGFSYDCTGTGCGSVEYEVSDAEEAFSIIEAALRPHLRIVGDPLVTFLRWAKE